MTLRSGLIGALVIGVTGCVVVLAVGQGSLRWLGLYFGAQALFCLGALLFERSRYRPSAGDARRMRPNGERLVDPVSGELTEVWEDPATGVREYRKVGTQQERR